MMESVQCVCSTQRYGATPLLSFQPGPTVDHAAGLCHHSDPCSEITLMTSVLICKTPPPPPIPLLFKVKKQKQENQTCFTCLYRNSSLIDANPETVRDWNNYSCKDQILQTPVSKHSEQHSLY